MAAGAERMGKGNCFMDVDFVLQEEKLLEPGYIMWKILNTNEFYT